MVTDPRGIVTWSSPQRQTVDREYLHWEEREDYIHIDPAEVLLDMGTVVMVVDTPPGEDHTAFCVTPDGRRATLSFIDVAMGTVEPLS